MIFTRTNVFIKTEFYYIAYRFEPARHNMRPGLKKAIDDAVSLLLKKKNWTE
jgi:hypothetical protein